MTDNPLDPEWQTAADAEGFALRVWCVVLGRANVEQELRVRRREDAAEAAAELVERVRASGGVALRCGWSWTDGRAAGGLRSCGTMPRR